MNTLVISDLQAPFQHRHALDFLRDTYRKWKCKKVICIGDEVDYHAISFHDKDPDGMGAMDEFRCALKFMKKLYKLFPKVEAVTSNHTARPFRVANKYGIPSHFLKGYKQLLEAPKGWNWQDKIFDKNVLYIHGEGYSGQYGAKNAAMRNRISTVIGHIHAHGGILYHSSDTDLIYGLNSGCLIDVHAYAFRYGKHFKDKPTLGCGVVVNDREAYFVPMDRGSKVRRTK